MFSPLYITIAILILIVFILIIHTFVLEHRLRSLFRGQKGQSLEKVIQDMQNRLNSHNAQAVKNSNDINNLSNRLRSRIRNVSTLRFKPFEDAG